MGAVGMPFGLGERGQAVWDAASTGDAVRDAVVLEAARTADRLDELDSVIQGKGVLNLMQFRVLDDRVDDDDTRNIHVEVKFQNVLSEARQQALALAGLLKSLSVGEAEKRQAPINLPENVSPLQRLTSKLNG